jgi:flavin-binding protein dodecin
MSELKVIEVLGNSKVSFDDAVKNVVTEASKSVKNIKSVYVKDMQATVENNQVIQYRVTTKVCFGIMDTE